MSTPGHTSKIDYPRSRSAFALGPFLGVLALAIAVASILWLHQPRPPALAGEFKLLDAKSGHQISDQDFRGKWLLIFFGYTHCPDVCPTTLNNIAGAMNQLGPLASEVQPLFITVDPQRDTPQVLSDYTAAFDPRIIGLTGSPGQIDDAAKRYGIYYAKRVVGDDYYMDHTAAIQIVRPDGTYALSLLSSSEAWEIAKRMRQLIGNG